MRHYLLPLVALIASFAHADTWPTNSAQTQVISGGYYTPYDGLPFAGCNTIPAPINAPCYAPALQRRIQALFANGEQGAWYDPSDFSTLFQDAAGTAPITAVGQPVGLMLDKSGRGNHASQATTANRPVLQQDAGGHYYLAFNGTNSSMATAAINFTATNKMTVVAGVRKLSDAVTGIIAELGASPGAVAGSFNIVGPSANGSPSYRVGVSGTTGQASYALTSFVSPTTNIITAQLDIAGATIASEIIPMINGLIPTKTVVAAGPTGAGNFGNYPLYICARAGTSLFFNGNLYSLIVRGAASSASQIQALEAYANSKTGAY